MFTIRGRAAAPLPALAAALLGCAVAAPRPDAGARSADAPLPQVVDIDDPSERIALGQARRELDRADEARAAGDLDRARSRRRAAAEALARLAGGRPPSPWRLAYARAAAEAAAEADAPDEEAAAASLLRDDPSLDPPARVRAARQAVAALRRVAEREVREGRLEPLAAERRAEARPRSIEGAWLRLLEAADAQARLEVAGPEAGGGEAAAAAALVAARVALGHDQLDDAQARLEALFRAWPLSPAAVEGAEPYLELFAARRDAAAQAAAAERTRARLEAIRPALARAAAAPDASPAARELPARADAARGRLARAAELSRAMALLRGGKAAEAAARFEAFAAAHPGAREAPSALYNAGVAWARARQPRRAQAARERLLASHPDAPEARPATLALAGARLDAGDGAGAAQLYRRYLERWPEGEQRCLALGNLGAALEEARQPLDAAACYAALGGDAACVEEDPATAARALATAGQLYLAARHRAEALAAFEALLALDPKADPEVEKLAQQARRRLEGMGP